MIPNDSAVLPDNVKVLARWHAKLESREQCAQKAAVFLIDMHALVGGIWAHLGKPLGEITEEKVSGLLGKNRGDDEKRTPIPDLGWSGNFQFLPNDRGTSSGYSRLEYKGGVWAQLSPYPNVNTVSLAEQLRDLLDINRSLVTAMIRHLQPDYVEVCSNAGSLRRAAMKSPFPIVDWMVYLANTIIPRDELPMVHSVEYIGTGTLVILKEQRLHLDKPEDLALVEAVEPIIRRYQPAPLPKQTHYPQQGVKN